MRSSTMGKTGVTIAMLGRKISAAIERLQIGREPDGHGPTAAAGGGLHEGHIDAVHIGALFAIHFDADEIRFMSAAIAAFSKDSRSMTWHQWQVE